MSVLSIPTAEVFEPLLRPSRYKAIHGGRGSGKSRFLSSTGLEHCIANPGTRWLCAREIQKSLKQSSRQLIVDDINRMGVSGLFKIKQDEIETPGGGVISFTGLQEHTADSIKSYEGYDICWVEEAHTVAESSLHILRPTLRKPGSELWFSWNPRRKSDAVDKFFCTDGAPDNAIVIKANWSDNPWFPNELELERIEDLNKRPELYDHIWEGGYASVLVGAYYAQSLIEAQKEGRITELAIDPLLQTYAYFDLGVSDATTIWIIQKIGQRINVLDYYEAVGQPLGAHLEWLRSEGYSSALCVLPHDGAQRDKVSAIRFEDHVRAAGFRVEVVQNQGRSAARRRIEATRRYFSRFWFDKKKTEPGREALGAYHEKWDEARLTGLGPNHDWASHGADSFGLIAVHDMISPNYTMKGATGPLKLRGRGVA